MDWNLILENSLKGFIGINAVYFAIAALGLNVQFGYTGLLNFGQAGFMACGAYGLGMTAHYFEISFWWVLHRIDIPNWLFFAPRGRWRGIRAAL